MPKPPQSVMRLARILEGLPGGLPALRSYKDQAGRWTVGYGHTGRIYMSETPGAEVGEGTVITEEMAEELLAYDMGKAQAAVESMVKTTLNDNQIGALTLFVLNIGISAFRNSTMLKLINEGLLCKAADQFDRWNKYTDPVTKEKKISHGLQNRRATEKALFLTPWHVVSGEPAPQAAPTYGAGAPTPPPTKVSQTEGGKSQITALVTGATAAVAEGVRQATPAVTSAREAANLTDGLPGWLRFGVIALVIVSIGCVAFVLWKKHRALKNGG